MAKRSNSSLMTPMLYILLGVMLVLFKDDVLGLLTTVAGIVFIASGIVDIVHGLKISAIFSITAGVVIFVLGATLTGIVLLVLGVLIAVKGAVDLIEALKRRRKSILSLLFPALTIVVGIALAFGNGIDYIIAGVGILLAVDGILGILSIKR